MIPVLETERLILRAPCEADVAVESAFYASERSAHVGGPLDPDQVWRMVATLLGHWQMRGYGFWAVEMKDTGEYAGRVGLWFPMAWPEREIGWSLMNGFEGRGIAYEAAIAARAYAYETLGWSTAISLISDGNHRSEALAQKLGASQEGPFTHPRFGAMNIWRHPAAGAA